MVYDLSSVKIDLHLNYVTGFQLILWAGHCFDLAVKQMVATAGKKFQNFYGPVFL